MTILIGSSQRPTASSRKGPGSIGQSTQQNPQAVNQVIKPLFKGFKDAGFHLCEDRCAAPPALMTATIMRLLATSSHAGRRLSWHTELM